MTDEGRVRVGACSLLLTCLYLISVSGGEGKGQGEGERGLLILIITLPQDTREQGSCFPGGCF